MERESLGTAVVTGGASPRGIGRATAAALAADGWAVAVLDVAGDEADAVARQIGDETGVPTLGVGCDVTDAGSVDAAFSAVEAELPPVTAVAAIAGVTSPVPFLEVDVEELERVLAVNVTGVFHTCKRVVPGMVERGYGRIVVMSSVSAQRGGGVFGATPYSASKGAVLGFTRSLARELGPHGVTVNAVAPGLIETDITAGRLSEEAHDRIVADTPVGRTGRVEDVARTVVFLCRPEAGYLTGATYDVNGGSHIH